MEWKKTKNPCKKSPPIITIKASCYAFHTFLNTRVFSKYWIWKGKENTISKQEIINKKPKEEKEIKTKITIIYICNAFIYCCHILLKKSYLNSYLKIWNDLACASPSMYYCLDTCSIVMTPAKMTVHKLKCCCCFFVLVAVFSLRSAQSAQTADSLLLSALLWALHDRTKTDQSVETGASCHYKSEKK